MNKPVSPKDNSDDIYPRLKELCQRHNIRFKKQLGQNMLLDDNINAIMVRAAGLTPEDSVIEVGSGLGALTRKLVHQAGRLLCVEIDASFMPCLEEQFGQNEKVTLFRGDILNHDLDNLIAEFLPHAGTLKMVSNLPYYVTTPVLFHFLESPVYFERLVVMTQYEVGQRLTAAVNSEDYGVLSIAARLYAHTDIVHRVPASCFLPRPKVDSCIVRFRCHEGSPFPGLEISEIMKVVRSAFRQRRKTLRNTLTGGNLGLSREEIMDVLSEVGIDHNRRAQTLDCNDFASLTAQIKTIRNNALS
ncbi:MAG: ribosomal RNA small subunit methyltransferase A [Candidatus Hydrogenedens sp.]|nr:ribosomal RNA small subunit methyltransferase A [Candidatus Hydrogenedens sp.]